ncbi:MAG: NUDIX domain-containing protein [bacterium]
MRCKILNRRQIHHGFLQLESLTIEHELFEADREVTIERELLSKGNAVAVLPYDPVRDEVVLIEQFRVGALAESTGAWLIEVIAGYQEANESSQDVVFREAIEEADCRITELLPIKKFYLSPGTSDECIELFLGLTDTAGVSGIHGLAEEGEDIRVHTLSSEDAFSWLDNGRINSAIPIVALQWLRLNRAQFRQC